jgi:hypothetical protein
MADVGIPVWKLEATITGLLTQPQLDRFVGQLRAQSELDAKHGRIFAQSEVRDKYTGEASGHLVKDGAVVAFLLGARDANHAIDRAKRTLRDTMDELRIPRDRVTFEVTGSILALGEVDARMAFQHHIATAISEFDTPYIALDAVRGQIEAALVHAEELGQETTGLQTISDDVDALREMLYETSMRLMQRLAEVETGTRG